MEHDTVIPGVLAGPVLRHANCNPKMLWLVTTLSIRWRFRMLKKKEAIQERDLFAREHTQIRIVDYAYLQLLKIRADSPWPGAPGAPNTGQRVH